MSDTETWVDDLIDLEFDEDQVEDPDDWEDDDDLFLEELAEYDRLQFIENFTSSKSGRSLDFDYDYDRDDYPYGYDKD